MSKSDLAKFNWAGKAAEVFLRCFSTNPILLGNIVSAGEDKFVRNAIMTDTLSITRAQYRRIFRMLRRKSVQLEYNPSHLQRPGDA